MKISAVLIVRNEEKNIKRCLESIKWCDEIVVVDQSSSDRTLEIAKNYTDKIFITQPKGICNPDRNFAISKSSYDWIFLVEADEVVDEELKKEIQENISRDEFDICFIPVKTFFIGRWIKTCGWYPSYIPRVFKKGSIDFQNEVHTNGVLKSNRICYFKNALLHYSYDSIDDWIEKFRRYTDAYAKEYYENGLRPSFLVFIREVILRPIYFFILKYIFFKGYRDGWRGFFISFSSGLTLMFAYFKFLEIYEKRK